MTIEAQTLLFGEPDDHLDELILDTEVGTATIREDLPLFREGFHWTTIVRDDRRVQGYVDEDATGVIDNDIVVEGTVEGIHMHPLCGDTALFVEPN